MQRKLLYTLLGIILFGCNPYSKILIKPESWFFYAIDSCDMLLLSKMADSLGYGEIDDTFNAKEPCEYIEYRKIRFSDDTIESLLAVRPLVVGDETAMLERIYTISDLNDSTIYIKCRTTEYNPESKQMPKKYVTGTISFPKQDTSLIMCELGDSCQLNNGKPSFRVGYRTIR